MKKIDDNKIIILYYLIRFYNDIAKTMSCMALLFLRHKQFYYKHIPVIFPATSGTQEKLHSKLFHNGYLTAIALEWLYALKI